MTETQIIKLAEFPLAKSFWASSVINSLGLSSTCVRQVENTLYFNDGNIITQENSEDGTKIEIILIIPGDV